MANGWLATCKRCISKDCEEFIYQSLKSGRQQTMVSACSCPDDRPGGRSIQSVNSNAAAAAAATVQGLFMAGADLHFTVDNDDHCIIVTTRTRGHYSEIHHNTGTDLTFPNRLRFAHISL